jgi:hypothetical protein
VTNWYDTRANERRSFAVRSVDRLVDVDMKLVGVRVYILRVGVLKQNLALDFPLTNLAVLQHKINAALEHADPER